MNKDPFFYRISRIIINIAILAFIAMLYWSSSLIEEDFKNVKERLRIIQTDLDNMKGQTVYSYQGLPASIDNNPTSSEHLQHSDNLEDTFQSSANLLSPDQFYTTTLPKILGTNFKPSGILRDWKLAKPNTLKPFSQWYDVAEWIRGCTLPLADNKIGIYETLAPQMAVSMEIRDREEGGKEIWMKLRHNVFWEPLNPLHFATGTTLAPIFLKRHQVTAHDYKFFYDAFMNSHVGDESAVTYRNIYQDLEDLKVIDDFTLVAQWKTKAFVNEEGKEVHKIHYQAKRLTASLRPLPCFVYKYFSDGTKILSDDDNPNTYRYNPIWAQNFAQHWANNVIISCGPWLFDGMTDREICFKRNSNFYHPLANLIESREIKFLDTFDSIWADFKAGNLDLYELPPSQVGEYEQFIKSQAYQNQVKAGLGTAKRLDYVAERYSYIGWNETNPLFKSKKVRQALTIAIDRNRIIRQNMNNLAIPITGTFYPYSPSYDHNIKPYPYDPDLARQMLLEEGWYDSTGNGIIDKVIEGKKKPFRFQLIYYVKDPTTKSIIEYVTTALKEIGIACEPIGLDIADIAAGMEDKSFDSLILNWVLDNPPEDPRQLWHSSGVQQKGSSNFISFSNHEIDQIIDELDYESNNEKRLALYHRFDRILYDEAPYVFLCARKVALIYRDYLQNVFIPAERQNIIPGANAGEPIPSIYWLNKRVKN